MKTRLPYESTEIAPEQTQAKITGLLYQHGAEATRWTTEKDGSTILEFMFSVEGGARRLAFRIVPPILLDAHGRRRTAQSMRLLFWWLKSQMEAIRYGLTSVEETFMAHIAGALPTGEQVTVGSLLLPKLRSGEALGPADIVKALPMRTKE